jgi:hypothetical protein
VVSSAESEAERNDGSLERRSVRNDGILYCLASDKSVTESVA